MPPVVNEPQPTAVLADAVELTLGEEGIVATTQSLGGEDFGWYLESVPGAMGRLGTRTPGGPTYDLHQGNLRVDERATAIGARGARPGGVRGATGRRASRHESVTSTAVGTSGVRFRTSSRFRVQARTPGRAW